MGKRHEIALAAVGRRFNKLTVTAVVFGGKRGAQTRAICECECGAKKSINLQNVKRGKQVSCGCHLAALKLRTDNKYRTHGLTKTKVYRTWQTMRKRCSRPGYKYYSSIGVKVCQRWEDAFENFLADMGEPPSKDHSIDRINPFGNYEPGNCRWATRSEQQRNRRISKRD